ncbi:MAG: exosortase C-terminal domain/associated protein EpsI [Terriglobales bacterium]
MTRKLIVIAAILAATFGLRTWLSAAPDVPTRQPLADFPGQLQGRGQLWTLVSQERVAPDVLNVLKADDYLLRDYRDSQGAEAGFFVAYYRNQKAGDAMHSPKNCLPGAGWEPVMNDRITVADTNGQRAQVNRYLVENEGNRMMVLYWYQAQGRIIASEYWGKFYLIWDALTQHRRDGAIVRVTLPMAYGESIPAATATALNLAQASLPRLGAFLPN